MVTECSESLSWKVKTIFVFCINPNGVPQQQQEHNCTVLNDYGLLDNHLARKYLKGSHQLVQVNLLLFGAVAIFRFCVLTRLAE